MLKVFYNFDEMDTAKLMQVYQEGCEENAAYFFPDETLEIGIKKEEEKFISFLKDRFFADERNSYYVLEKDGVWVSALRMTRLDGFYYLEALETEKNSRRKGYAAKLLNEVIAYLKEKEGEAVIRDNVHKKNIASLATHEKCGFVIEHQEGIYYLNGSVNPQNYGMLYKSRA